MKTGAPRSARWLPTLLCWCLGVVSGTGAFAPVPRLQALPLPQDQISFQKDGIELTRYYYGTNANRPFLYPIIGPNSQRSLTRMGHPHDQFSHRHHNSVWLSHQLVNGANFWEDNTNQVILQRQFEAYTRLPRPDLHLKSKP